jgi:hypothetical protein
MRLSMMITRSKSQSVIMLLEESVQEFIWDSHRSRTLSLTATTSVEEVKQGCNTPVIIGTYYVLASMEDISNQALCLVSDSRPETVTKLSLLVMILYFYNKIISFRSNYV